MNNSEYHCKYSGKTILDYLLLNLQVHLYIIHRLYIIILTYITNPYSSKTTLPYITCLNYLTIYNKYFLFAYYIHIK